ncbi:hypothetical protein AYO22_11602 [Fonsecaea multimorphosa]|nr:hypothetical protein AYO22_11602 [Fonsecaea multimorphosa]
MAKSCALNLAPIQLLKDLEAQKANKKRELEVTDADDQQERNRRNKKQVHWDLPPMPPSPSPYSSSSNVHSDLAPSSTRHKLVEPDVPDAHHGKPPCKRRELPRSGSAEVAFTQAAFHYSGSPCYCSPATASWIPKLPLFEMPWLLSGSPQVPALAELIDRSEVTQPASHGNGWINSLKLPPIRWQGPENPQGATATGNKSIEHNDTEFRAEDVASGRPEPDANTSVPVRDSGTADALPISHLLNQGSEHSTPPYTSYVRDNMVPQDSAPIAVRPVPVSDMSFCRQVDQGAAYSYAPPSPAYPVGGYTPPNSAVGPSPVMPTPGLAPTVTSRPVEQSTTYGYPPPPPPRAEKSISIEVPPCHQATVAAIVAWPTLPNDQSYICPVQEAPVCI